MGMATMKKRMLRRLTKRVPHTKLGNKDKDESGIDDKEDDEKCKVSEEDKEPHSDDSGR